MCYFQIIEIVFSFLVQKVFNMYLYLYIVEWVPCFYQDWNVKHINYVIFKCFSLLMREKNIIKSICVSFPLRLRTMKNVSTSNGPWPIFISFRLGGKKIVFIVQRFLDLNSCCFLYYSYKNTLYTLHSDYCFNKNHLRKTFFSILFL